jgi:hypothetical protein
MSLRHLFTYARSLTPGAAISKTSSILSRHVGANWSAWINAGRCTYAIAPADFRLPLPPKALRDHLSATEALNSTHRSVATRYAAHEFDLLGSGWIKVEHGMSCRGFEGAHYRADAPRPLTQGNRRRSDEIRAHIAPNYAVIDWQLDFKSGYRWSEDKWSATILYGHEPGVDIKVPWELARLQHLVTMALAGRDDALYKQECRNQILDFIAANPPGYGVNWVCTMDVAIRAANMVLAHWLLGPGDGAFELVLGASLLDHGRHIMANLENGSGMNGNHYLADVCGLTFIAAALPEDPETRAWWQFAVTELLAETEAQFQLDGTNFEASTCYHRLSAEMISYTTALILGRAGPGAFPHGFAERLHRMARFSMDVTKPGGRVVQVGDNDSGRFFKLSAAHFTDELSENHLDHRSLTAAVAALIDDNVEFVNFAGPEFAFETQLVAALAGERKLPLEAVPKAMTIAVSNNTNNGKAEKAGRQSETQIPLADPDIVNNIELITYPNFGLFIFKSPRFFLSVRCGPIGQNGRGGHAHNDQLAIELHIDDVDWLTDPGSYVYTAAPKRRDAYRSVMAHAAPRLGEREPGRLDLGLFRLGDEAKARCLHFDKTGFEGCHVGFGTPVYRAIKIEKSEIRIRDSFGGRVDWDAEAETTPITSADDLQRHFGMNLPFSPAYGVLDDA